jgi:UDP-GlcNAc3NAcA epimerase
MKIFTIVGARPQFVKAAVVSREFAKHAQIQEFIIHTGQHFDENMSAIFFNEMEIPKPAFNLGIHGKNHGAMTGEMMSGLEQLYMEHRPDLVLVYGDTNSTLAGALTAVKLHIPVAHVEAGLRSFNMLMPEEVNRILTDRISNYLFCPTQTAVDNLQKEGYPFANMRVELSGDVMQDAAMYYAKTSEAKSTILSQLPFSEFHLCTLHRAENTDDPERLKSIATALSRIHAETPIVMPLHPRTKKIIAESGIHFPVHVIDPVGYFDMLELLKNCKMVFTDSGGLQKEAFFFQKQCITLREETEWVELVDGGYNQLAGSDTEKIMSAYSAASTAQPDYNANLYGGGKAAENIVKTLLV